MKKRGMEQKKLAAAFITVLIVSVLIFSGPARAITLGFERTDGSDDPIEGETVSFAGKVDIHTTDMVTLKYLVVLLDNTTLDSLTNAVQCRYYFNGTAVPGNDAICNITFTSITADSTPMGDGYGYGYGYGYKVSTGITNTSLFNFNYGYQYGYTPGLGSDGFNTTVGITPEIAVSFSWNVPDVDSDKPYNIGFGVLAGESDEDRVLFMSQDAVSLNVLTVRNPWYADSGDTSAGSVDEGTPVNVFTKWNDDTGLDYASLYTNTSGAWENPSNCTLSGEVDWCNATIPTAGLAGSRVCWNMYAWDDHGLLNDTMVEQCFDVNDITFPTYSAVSDDSGGAVDENTPVHVYSYWEDDLELDAGILYTDASGSMQPEGTCALANKGDWCNATIPTVGLAGESICWMITVNDTSGNMNESMDEQCFDVDDITFPTYSEVSDDSGGAVDEGTAVHVTSYWNDNVGLNGGILYTNSSGSMQPTGTCAMAGDGAWCDATIHTEDMEGHNICWLMWGNDTSGNMNESMDEQCFDVHDITPPEYSSVSDDSAGSVDENTPVRVYSYWEDNLELDAGILYTDASGSMEPAGTCALTGTGDWCNATIPTAGMAGESICWMISANDTSGNRNQSMDEQCFDVHDITIPFYSDVSDNSEGAVDEGETVDVHSYWEDNLELDAGILYTDESGVMQPERICALTGTGDWCNATILTDSLAGESICWKIYANDTSNNMNTTMDEQCFDVNDITFPTYSDDNDTSDGAVDEGQLVNVSVLWGDNVELGTAIFRHNATGNWTSVGTCALTTDEDWCNKSINTSGLAGHNICWNMYANDTSSHMNDTMDAHCFEVLDITHPRYDNVSDDSSGDVTEGDTVTVSADWADDLELATAIFRHNATGNWSNVSTCALNGTNDECEKTIATDDLDGSRICWNMYANDTSGNLNDTMDAQCFDVNQRTGGGSNPRRETTGGSGPVSGPGAQTIFQTQDTAFSQIQVNSLTPISDPSLKVEEVTEIGTDASGFAISTPMQDGKAQMVYKYLKITPSAEVSEKVTSAKISFEVDSAWLTENGLDPTDVVLLRYVNGAWVNLPTTLVRSESGVLYYEAVTPGFSLFAVGIRKASAAVPQTVPSVITPPVTPTTTPPEKVCIQVITFAVEPSTNDCYEFSTPCDVPKDWSVVDKCPGKEVLPVARPTGLNPSEKLAIFLGGIVVVLLVLWLFVYRRPGANSMVFSKTATHRRLPK